MARVTFNGPAGEHFENTTAKVLYQFVAALRNTCGVCLQYHMAIGPWWPIPLHHGCQCRQVLIAPGARSPEPFVDYREMLRDMAPDQQTKAVGRSTYKLIEEGVIPWDEAVTKGRVRTLREIVSRRKLSIEDMVKHGVDPRIAAEAHAAVNTPAHKILYEQRRKLVADLKGAGLTDAQLKQGFGSKIAERVGVQNPATQAVRKIGPKWTDGASLAKFLGLNLPKVAKALAVAEAVQAPIAPAEEKMDPADRMEQLAAYARSLGFKAEAADAAKMATLSPDAEGMKAALASYDPKTRTIYFNADSSAWKDPKKFFAEMKRIKFYVDPTPRGIANHEIGHAALHGSLAAEHGDDGGLKRFRELGRDEFRGDENAALRDSIRKHVSRDAAMDKNEFAAEIHAGLKAGKTFPEALMKLYGSIGGRIP